MNLLELSKAVEQAEVEAKMHAERARGSWKQLKSGAAAAATPWRIVTVGVVAGFFAGRRSPAAGPGAGSQLFSSLAQSLITALGASITAGAAASSAADAAAAATVDATAKAQAMPTAPFVPVEPGTPGAVKVPYVAEMADVEDRG